MPDDRIDGETAPTDADRMDGETTPTDADRTGRDGPEDRPSTGAIERALGRLAPRGASASVLAVRATDGAVVAAADPDRSVAPASNTKLLTAALALDRLGPDHRFATTVATRGPVDDRVLDGDLVLAGSGAPDLAPDDIANLAGGVADHLDRVEGDLVCDCAAFAGPQLGPGRVWTDEHHAYGARSSALALSGNLVSVAVSGTGGDVAVSVDPETEAVDVEVDVAVDPSAGEVDGGPDLGVRTPRERGCIRVEGALSPGEDRTVRVPIADPVRHCGLATRDALAAAGVEMAGTVRVVDRQPGEATTFECAETTATLGSVESAPLGDLVRTMNVDSDNFVADQLARAVAETVTGEGSWEAWEEVVADHLAALDVETVRVCDGSGLSRYNRVPARAVVAVLEWVADQPWSAVFFDSLPEPGEGTLADRLDGVPVVAKTGTLTGARALSGRVDRGGDDVLFSALVGGITVAGEEVRDRQDEFVRALAADE